MSQILRTLMITVCFVCIPHALAQARAENTDPLEPLNRAVHGFNVALDSVVIRPLAVGYHYVMPQTGERGVRNFFANLWDLNAALNASLQGRLGGAARNGSRFVVNSTLGMFGVIDVASEMGISPYRTDFGHTLALWGVGSGPFVMVPFFGPRSFRSSIGTVFDTVFAPQSYISDVPLRNSLYALEVIDIRATLLGADQLVSGDDYIFLRDAYLQQREYLVNDGILQDDFSNFEDDFEWE